MSKTINSVTRIFANILNGLLNCAYLIRKKHSWYEHVHVSVCVPAYKKVFKQVTCYDETSYENHFAGATSCLYILILYQYNRYTNF